MGQTGSLPSAVGCRADDEQSEAAKTSPERLLLPDDERDKEELLVPEQQQHPSLNMKLDANGNYHANGPTEGEHHQLAQAVCQALLNDLVHDVIIRCSNKKEPAEARINGDYGKHAEDAKTQTSWSTANKATQVKKDAAEDTELQEEIRGLQEALNRSRSRLEVSEEDLLKERVRAGLLRRELRVQEETSTIRISQLEEEADSVKQDLDRFHRESNLHRETFQKTLRALKCSLDDKDALIQEKEDSNHLLRKDLLDLMSQFNEEKAHLERRISELKLALESQSAAADESEQMLQATQRKLEKRTKQKRRATSEVARVRAEMEEVFRKNQRGFRMARVLDHIDNID